MINMLITCLNFSFTPSEINQSIIYYDQVLLYQTNRQSCARKSLTQLFETRFPKLLPFLDELQPEIIFFYEALNYVY